MKSQNKIFKKDLYRKFLLFSILPLILLSLIFVFLIIREKFDLILSQHTNIIKNIQYNINIFNQDIKDIPELLKGITNTERKKLLSDILKYKNSIDTIMILNKTGIIEEISSKTNIKVFEGYDYSQKPIFKEYIEKKNDFLSNIYFSNLADTPLVSYVFEFHNQIFIIELNLDFINKLVLNLNPSTISDVSVSIIDKNGLYILDTFDKFNVKNRNSFFTTKLYKDNIAINSENSLIKYFNESSKKYNYVSYMIFNNLSWMIIVKENNNKIDEYIFNVFLVILFIISIIAFIIIMTAKKIVNNIVNPLELLTLNINKFTNDHSSKIDGNIRSDYNIFTILIKNFKYMQKSIIDNEESLKQQIVQNQQKDKILNEQSKMAAMGEMICNIAHQWRQPLSAISTAATGIIIQKEYNMFEEDKLVKTCSIINDNAQYLSRTIDDFKNFIKGDRTKKIFNLNNNIESFLHLVDSSIKNNQIKIILDLQEDIQIDGYENELIQCLINIFNNAKDALKEKNIGERLIFISTYINEDKTIIKIKDNAGGIQPEVLPHIFEAYFTTKHKSQGTGLGLNMTYNLIVNGMSGNIEVKNITYEYEGNNYSGAEFFISL
ncbi:MAG: ATP-binding protein [Candidatus Paceibacteria bacterium]